MKKFVLVMTASAFVLGASALNADFGSEGRTEPDKVMNLSAGQIAKIKEINREAGLKFQAIGRSNLPGYEKGQRKREVALERKAAIMEILDQKQVGLWEGHYGSMDRDDDLRNIVQDYYESRIDELEHTYERDKNRLEHSSLPKHELKEKLEAFKREYKAEKQALKNQCDRDLRSGVLAM